MDNKILYHGTTADFYPPFKNVPTFFSGSFDFAIMHSETQNGEDEDDERIVVAKCFFKKEPKLFDPRNGKYRFMAMSEIPKTVKHKGVFIDSGIVINKIVSFDNDVWEFLEIPEVIETLKRFGFDGHIAKENDEITYCIYEPDKFVRVKAMFGEMTFKEYEEIFDN